MQYLTSPNLTALPHIRHGFFTRNGGVSNGIYGSLNCGPGSGDNIENVMENRLLVQKAMEVGALLTCHQYHSASVRVADAAWPWQEAPKADAMVTKTPGIALGILTADCLPVLFADAQAKVIGAAHAGWKGTLAGVLENTLAAMEKLGAARQHIIAAIGPGIAQKSYEVGAEFRERFIKVWAEGPHPNPLPTGEGSSGFAAAGEGNARYFLPSTRPDHYLFDLKGYAVDRLRAMGIAVNLLERDTCFEEDAFFSFRRATLRGEPSYGRLISIITLER